MTFKYTLCRGMDDIIEGGFNTEKEAREVGKQVACILSFNGLDTYLFSVEEETEEPTEQVIRTRNPFRQDTGESAPVVIAHQLPRH